MWDTWLAHSAEHMTLDRVLLVQTPCWAWSLLKKEKKKKDERCDIQERMKNKVVSIK